MPDHSKALLVAHVIVAGLPDQEPFMQWVESPDEHVLELRAHDRALLVDDLVEYLVPPRAA